MAKRKDYQPLSEDPQLHSIAVRAQQPLGAKRRCVSPSFLPEQHSRETTLSWVNSQLSATDYADVERIRTKVRSKGAGFRKFFYTTVLQSLNQNTRAQILELWADTMDSFLLDMLNLRLRDIEHTISMDLKGYYVLDTLCYILLGSHGMELPYATLRKALSSSDISLHEREEVEKLLLLSEIEGLGWFQNNGGLIS